MGHSAISRGLRHVRNGRSKRIRKVSRNQPNVNFHRGHTPFILGYFIVHKLLHIFVVPSPNVDRLAIPRDRLHTRFLDVLSDFSIQLQRLGLDAPLQYEHALANPHYSHRFLDKFETMAFLHHANGIRMVTWYKTTAKHEVVSI